MKYIVLVSHGVMAPGLHSALDMLAGKDRKDILSTSLQDGMSADQFGEEVKKLLAGLESTDEILLMGDLAGGSPLTVATNVIAEMGMLGNTVIFGGMNLPLALSAALMKDSMELSMLKEELLAESREELKEVVLETEAEEDEI